MHVDQNLIDKIKAGDTKELGIIYVKFREEFISWLIKTYKCKRDDAEEHYQFVILTIYENIIDGRLVKLTSSIKTYLFSIGKYRLLETSKKSNRIAYKIDEEHFEYENSVEKDFEQEEKLIKLAESLLVELGDPCKTLLRMFYYQKKSMEFITQKLGYKNSTTAKNSKYKCLQRLRQLFRDNLNTEEGE